MAGQRTPASGSLGERAVVISQGDVFWVHLPRPQGSEPGYGVVVQNNVVNRTRINTVVVCGLIWNLSGASSPGNVVLRRGEANLPQASVVDVSQIFTLDKSQLGNRLGTLSPERVREILAGITFLLEPREPPPTGET